MTLREKRCLFTSLLPRLIDYMCWHGFEVAIDDAKARSGHKNNSLHYVGLAVDFNLYRDGKWLDKSADHAGPGAFWKSLHPLCRWGGDFKHPDGNHYSIEHEGRM